MNLLKLIWHGTLGGLKNAALFPQSVALALKERRQRSALDAREAERLDRIRNPSKYLGKS